MIQIDPANPWTSPPAGRAQPGLVLLRDWLIETYGGVSLGIYVDRPMRGSRKPSLHRDGRALDWRHDSEGVRQRVFDALVAGAEKPPLVEFDDRPLVEQMQIQRIHFYSASLAWDADKGTHRAKGESFGDASARWLHIERNLAGSTDLRPIAEIIAPPTIEDDDMPRLVQRKDPDAAGQRPIAVTDGIFRNDLGPTELAAVRAIWPTIGAPVVIASAAFDALVLNSKIG